MDLKSWLDGNRSQLGSRFEALFVENVLSRVPELDPLALHAQYRFVDADGGTRFCDFAIKEGDDLRIAIEIDGYDKRGTGQGMTHEEFKDWQRRQASLVAQGWSVLRFANADVRDQAARCAEHVRLLLRRERTKQSHREGLQSQIRAAERELQEARQRVAEERATYGASPADAGLGQKSGLEELRRLLKLANVSGQLSESERSRLKELDDAQRDLTFLRKETSTMKTTIWAMTALIAFLILLFALDRFRPAQLDGSSARTSVDAANAMPVTEPASAPVSEPAKTESVDSWAGSSCEHPLPWKEARSRIGTTTAIIGPVARVTRRDDIRGKPTFITVGMAFPSHDRMDVVIWGSRRDEFAQVLKGLEGRDACFFAEVAEREGIPQMTLTSRTQLLRR